jgi:glyoxylase-like metal-dependent hydrolase (beta-lactamase superfamily II)
MNNQIYEFKLGAWTCWALKDADAEATGQEAFPSASEDEIKAAAQRFGFQETIEQSYTVLLVDTGNENILIDTGNGSEHGRLFTHLATLGVHPESIDIVILSHLHGDHYQGHLNPAAGLNFPNAKHFIWREEWDFYCNPESLADERKEAPKRLAHKQRFLLPLAPHWHFLDESQPEIINGISAIPSPGHTAHHIAIRLESQGEILYFAADLYIHPAYIETPNWKYKSDFDADMTIASRKQINQRIADEQALVLAYHFAFPGIGRIVAEGEGFRWQAL